MTTDGCEWLVEAYGCDPVRLADLVTLRAVFAHAIDELRLTTIGEPVWHVFPGHGGITGMCMLAESHLTVHTFPEHGSLCLNLFCCRPRSEYPWADRLREHVGAETVEVRRYERSYGMRNGEPRNDRTPNHVALAK